MPLTITIPGQELWDPVNEVFCKSKPVTLALEHSLVSLSKWESKWKKPFLALGQNGAAGRSQDPDKQLSPEQFLDYVRCMTMTQNVDDNVYHALTKENLESIVKYIEDPMTATTISNHQRKKGPPRVITSELIYAWMAILRIPYECQKWHLNRLMMLIQVTGLEQEPPKKMDPRAVMKQNQSLNAARRAKHHTRG